MKEVFEDAWKVIQDNRCSHQWETWHSTDKADPERVCEACCRREYYNIFKGWVAH